MRNTVSAADLSVYREDFPGLRATMHGKALTFLDSAASAQKPEVVLSAMDSVLREGYANIHRGLYEISQNLTADFEAVRGKVARFIGAPAAGEIVFTRNATEAINLVAQSWGKTYLCAGDEIVLTEMEHHANIVPWQILRDQIGLTIRVLPVDDDGELILDQLGDILGPRTRLVSFTYVSNALGTVNPVGEIVRRVKAYNPDIVTLVDASQGVVHRRIDVSALGTDFLVFTGHKLYGPTGIGVLYGRKMLLESMPPYQGGGDMIESVSFERTTFKSPPQRFEAGTPPIVEVIGLGAAIDYVWSLGLSDIESWESRLLAIGTNALESIEGLRLYGRARDKASILSFTIDGIHPGDLGMILDQCGVAVRVGHHCCMPLMRRLGLDATCRASLALYSNEDDINNLVTGLHKAIRLLA
ncbi:MAG: SufS family cysteine desulfurase [Alphaproteobacteria bacterium]|nr:SufS family cysteine desulfurase [Alphaproteobacteria bacterium]